MNLRIMKIIPRQAISSSTEVLDLEDGFTEYWHTGHS